MTRSAAKRVLALGAPCRLTLIPYARVAFHQQTRNIRLLSNERFRYAKRYARKPGPIQLSATPETALIFSTV